MLRMRNKIIADKKKISLSSLPTIMIVDDDKQLSKSFEAILDIYGYPVLKVAHSVDEAIMFMEACKDKEARPQIIMTDYHMGVKTGADLLRWIKKNYEMWKETRTILISGGAKKEEILEAGAHISLEKPVRIEELIGSLFELVPHKIDFKEVLKLSPVATQIHNKSIFNEMTESQRNFADKIRHDMGNYLQPLGNIDVIEYIGFGAKEEMLKEVTDSLRMIKEMTEKLSIIFKKIISSEPIIDGNLYSKLQKNEHSIKEALKIISAVQQEADNTDVIKFLEVFISEMDRLNSEFSKILSLQEEGWINKGIAVRTNMFQLLKIWFPVMY